MKTKLVSIVAAVLLFAVLLCCGCGEQQPATNEPSTEPAQLTASEVLKAALEKVGEENEVKATVGVTMKMSGMTVDMPMEMTVKSAKKGDAIVTLADISMSLMGQDIDMSMYVEDGTEYVTATFSGMTTQFKAPAGNNGIPDVNILSGLYAENELNISDDALTMTEEADGSKTIAIAMPADILNELMNSTMSATGGEVAGDMTFTDSATTVKIDKDGNIVGVNLKLDATMNDPTAGEVNCVMVFDIQYVNPGQPVVITPPEGYLDFPSQMDEL